MEQTRIITAVTSQLRLPATLLEEIVNHRTRRTKYDYPVTGIENNLSRNDLATILAYSIQTTVKGCLKVEVYNNRSGMVELVLVPIASSFLVTCATGKENKFKVEFSTSLN